MSVPSGSAAQSRAVPSLEPVTMVRPLGSKSMLVTASRWPASDAISVHPGCSRCVPSRLAEAVAISLPSGLKAAALTAPTAPGPPTRSSFLWPVATSQRYAAPSWLEVTSERPSGEKRSART